MLVSPVRTEPLQCFNALKHSLFHPRQVPGAGPSPGNWSQQSTNQPDSVCLHRVPAAPRGRLGHSCVSPEVRSGDGWWVLDGAERCCRATCHQEHCILYHKLTEVIEVVQTQFILAGFAAVTELALFSALKFSPLTRCRGLCCLPSCRTASLYRQLGISFSRCFPGTHHARATLPSDPAQQLQKALSPLPLRAPIQVHESCSLDGAAGAAQPGQLKLPHTLLSSGLLPLQKATGDVWEDVLHLLAAPSPGLPCKAPVLMT